MVRMLEKRGIKEKKKDIFMYKSRSDRKFDGRTARILYSQTRKWRKIRIKIMSGLSSQDTLENNLNNNEKIPMYI